jgi:hypothetical protein
MEVSGQLSRSGRFTPGQEPPVAVGGWVGPIPILEAVVKNISSTTGNQTPVVQPVA